MVTQCPANELTTADMHAVTVRLSDRNHERLKALSKQRNVSMNGLINEMASLVMANLEAEETFKVRTDRGRKRVDRGMALLRKSRGE